MRQALHGSKALSTMEKLRCRGVGGQPRWVRITPAAISASPVARTGVRDRTIAPDTPSDDHRRRDELAEQHAHDGVAEPKRGAAQVTPSGRRRRAGRQRRGTSAAPGPPQARPARALRASSAQRPRGPPQEASLPPRPASRSARRAGRSAPPAPEFRSRPRAWSPHISASRAPFGYRAGSRAIIGGSPGLIHAAPSASGACSPLEARLQGRCASRSFRRSASMRNKSSGKMTSTTHYSGFCRLTPPPALNNVRCAAARTLGYGPDPRTCQEMAHGPVTVDHNGSHAPRIRSGAFCC